MYDQAASLRSARRQMDLPVAIDPVAGVRVILGRVRKLLSNYLPGMSWDRRRWRESLSAPVKEPALERERLFVLGWLRWLEGDWLAAESLFSEVHSRCQAVPADEPPPTDLPLLEPGLLLARSAYWCGRVRVLQGKADAISGYESAMRRLGGSPQATAWYVDLLWRAGRIDRAEQVWKAVRTNKRVLACDEGPLFDAKSHLRKGELGPAEKLLREATPTNGIVWVERQLLLSWALAGLRQTDRAAEAMRLACDGPYPLAALTAWRNLLEGRGRIEPVELESTSPGWRELVEAQRLRARGEREAASALYRVALTHVAVQPFARFGLACLGQDEPSAVLAAGPGLFFALRCRAKQGIDRFRRRESSPAELLDVLQQASNSGYQDGAAEHFRRLAMALQQKPTPTDLGNLLESESDPAARRNAIRVILEQVRRLAPGESLPLLQPLFEGVGTDESLRKALGRQWLRLALLQASPILLTEAAELLPNEPLVGLVRELVVGDSESVGEAHPVKVLLQAATQLAVAEPLTPTPQPEAEGGAGTSSSPLPCTQGRGVGGEGSFLGEGLLPTLRGLRSQSGYRGIAQALLLQEAANRTDLGVVGGLLEEVDAWRAFRAGPPRFVLAALAALAAGQPGHAVWRRCLPRWLPLWDPATLGSEGAILAGVAGTAEGAGGVPSGMEPGSWFLHQAARALQREDFVEALSFVRRAQAVGASLPSEDVVSPAIPALERRADAQSLTRCFPEAGTSPSLLTDLVDLLNGLPEGADLLQQARVGDRAAVQSGIEALTLLAHLPSRLHHHLALLFWRSAQRVEETDPARAAVLYRQSWRSWLAFLASPEAPAQAELDGLLDHLMGVHRRRIDLVARGDLESARRHWELIQSLPSLQESMAEKVNRFRDDLATEYLLTTRESMRHGTIPEGWRADYERGLSLLCRLMSLDRDNVRLLTALVEVSADWFLDLYNTQASQKLLEQVGRYTPFALQLVRLIKDRPGELPARSALSEFYKFRGFVEPDPAAKIGLYRESLLLNPGNGNVRELLAGLGASDIETDTSSPSGSEDA